MGGSKAAILAQVVHFYFGAVGHITIGGGRKMRKLIIIDLFTRECLAIEVGFSLRAEHVVAAMTRLEYSRGLPERIFRRQRLGVLRWADGPVGLQP